MNKKKKDFDLEGVEISEDDIDLIESRINELNMPLEQLCDIVLESIRMQSTKARILFFVIISPHEMSDGLFESVVGFLYFFGLFCLVFFIFPPFIS